MSGEPIMPVHVRGGEHVTSTHFTIEVTIEGPNECVLVFLTPASWRAMVERACLRAYTRWGTSSDSLRAHLLAEMGNALRAALDLPDGWTP